MADFVTPWRVRRGVLRMAGSPQVIWIEDAQGNDILPWPAFDGKSKTKALRIARLIVKSVNCYATRAALQKGKDNG